MDPELIAYLDERFRGIDASFTQQIQGLREETSQQIQGLREETSQQIQGLREETSQQIQGLREETSQQFAGMGKRFVGMDKRFDQMDEQLRLTGVRVESLQSQIQQVAEGVAAGNETLEAFKKDVAKEFSDTRDMIKDGYRELDKRVKVLERQARIS